MSKTAKRKQKKLLADMRKLQEEEENKRLQEEKQRLNALMADATDDDEFYSDSEEDGAVTIFDVLKRAAKYDANKVKLAALAAKLQNVENKAEFMVDLMSLNAVEWRLVGRPESVINERVDERLDRIRGNVSDSRRLTALVKRVNNHRDILLSMKIQLTEGENLFLSLGNLIKLGMFGGEIDQLRTLAKRAYARKGERVSLEYAQNPWLPKLLTSTSSRLLIALRTKKTLWAIRNPEKVGKEELPESTPLEEVNFKRHHPRYWATLVSPRNVLVSRGVQGAALSLEEKKEVKIWIAQMEAMIMKAAEMYDDKLDFNFQRFELVNGVSKPTEYWTKVVAAYRELNPLLIKLRGDGNEKNTYTAWNDVDMGDYDVEAFFKDLNEK